MSQTLTFSVGLRRFTYAAHVTSSVGWLGAVLVFIALAALGLSSQDERMVRGAYLVMAPAAWCVLVPLAHASLLSGIALSLGTRWGMVRHYWVAIKLVITLFSTAILLIYMGTFRQMAGVAADPVVELELVRNPSPLTHAILAVILLIAATVLAIYKPFGMTPYGMRKQTTAKTGRTEPTAHNEVRTARTYQWRYVFLLLALAALVLIIVSHLLGSATQRH